MESPEARLGPRTCNGKPDPQGHAQLHQATVTRHGRTLAKKYLGMVTVVEAPPEATGCRGTRAGLREHASASREAASAKREGSGEAAAGGGW